ncbi:MAG: hypothetical protein CFE37_07655 [Alphaproteobacteria bacterium PA4]|nr:MAG: hypothetical protein CFE37_07655 [Alphaproteobacteria bacterium PA4]
MAQRLVGGQARPTSLAELRAAGGRDGDVLFADAALLADLGAAGVAAIAVPIVIAASDDVPAAVIDGAAGVIFADDDAAVVAAVLAQAVAPASGWRVGDFSDTTRGKINALSAEAQRIAEALNRLAAEERQQPIDTSPVDAALVRRLIRVRRERDRWFPAEIFADPAWDMLLDLIAARMEGKTVPVSSLCIASAVPTSTALRWVRSLQEAGLFLRHTDPGDARRSYITLSDTAAAAMLAWLRAFAGQFAPR